MPTTEVRVSEVQVSESSAVTGSLHLIVWEFEVTPGTHEAFLEAYGPEGDWAQLFGRSEKFLGLDLVKSVQHSNRFFTFDHWASSEAFERFHDSHKHAYQALDKKLARLTAWERRIGAFPSE